MLDVGCGDGQIDTMIMRQRPDLSIEGIDVLQRPGASITVRHFDGVRIPYENASVDVVMFVDVLHHTADPASLLAEACRVARKAIVMKDHLLEGPLAGPTLRGMDWFGNAAHGVALPYNYWTRSQWQAAFSRFRLQMEVFDTKLGLYPFPASLLFGRQLHFVTCLRPPHAPV